jgi:nucleotide-binding universal stress UspA family protein
MKILLAVDSPVSDAAVREVARRPWPPNTTVSVLTVLEPSQIWDVPSLMEGFKETAEETVRSAVDQLRSAGLSATGEVLCGDAKTVIVDYAYKIGAEVIVVGSRGATGFTRFLLGSVASAVAHAAPCSVEVVRASPSDEPQHKPMKILLATDGSECSQAAARSIAERPWPEGTEIRVISVVEAAVPLLGIGHLSHAAMENLRADAMRKAEDAEMAAEQVLADAGLQESGTVVVPTATPEELILQSADEWGADLIVCGSHGRRGLSRLLLGSVSEGVASHAKCSVEIIRQPAMAH